MQIPDPSSVMDSASSTGSWVVVLLCFLVLSMVGGCVMLFKLLRDTYRSQAEQLIEAANEEKKEALDRETRHTERIDKLENLHFSKLTELLESQVAIASKTESTLALFCDVQRTINGDLKALCALLSKSPCLLMRGSDDIKMVDKQGNELKSILTRETETG